jgi:ABC-2 type transport system ATP-binding protein
MIAFFAELRGLGRRDAAHRTGAWLERLGIADWRDNRVQDLSKGMQQKVQFATALIHEPELLILDEPWSGLDPINSDVLRDVVLEQKQAGRTIVFSTHLMEQAEQICDRVCIVASGLRELDGDLREIKRAAAGDRRIALAFDDEAAAARAKSSVLADPALVSGVKQRRDYIEVALTEGVNAADLLAAVVASRLDVRRFERVEPSLHEIFVDRVGADAVAGKYGRS